MSMLSHQKLKKLKIDQINDTTTIVTLKCQGVDGQKSKLGTVIFYETRRLYAPISGVLGWVVFHEEYLKKSSSTDLLDSSCDSSTSASTAVEDLDSEYEVIR